MKNNKVNVIAEIGINNNGDIEIAKQLIMVAKSAGCDYVKFQKRNQSETFLSVQTNLHDEASLENLSHCLIQAHLLGITSEDLHLAISGIKPVSMRLEIKEGIRNNQLIDDSYNNDIDGLKLALPLFKRYDEKKKVLP